MEKNSQLQQCPVGAAVSVLLLALLLEVALESTNSLRVVTLKAVDNVGDVVGPLGRVFAVHGVGFLGYIRDVRGDVGGRFAMVGQRKDFDGLCE